MVAIVVNNLQIVYVKARKLETGVLYGLQEETGGRLLPD